MTLFVHHKRMGNPCLAKDTERKSQVRIGKRSEKYASVQQDKTCSWLDLIRGLNVKPALFERNSFSFPMPPKELGHTYLLKLVPIGLEVQ